MTQNTQPQSQLSQRHVEEALALLRRARRRVATSFCHESAARDMFGCEVYPWSADAASFDGLGAVAAEQAPDPVEQAARDLLFMAAGQLDGDFLLWQDSQSQQTMLETYDRALALGEGELTCG